MDLNTALQISLNAAKIADTIMLEHYRSDFKTFTKEGAHSKAEAVVTEPDLMCDEAIVGVILSEFPDAVIVSEESLDRLKQDWHQSEWIWYVDPIDGSLSYLEGSDNFGVSIALVHNGTPKLGVITNPVKNQVAWGVVGQRAELNGKPLHFNRAVNDPVRQILSVGQNRSKSYSFVNSYIQPEITLHKRSVVTKTLSVLDGSAEYYFSLPYEVFLGGQPNYWDLAGSAAIVEAAGGYAKDIYGNEFNFNGNGFKWPKGHIFSHPKIVDSFRNRLTTALNDVSSAKLEN